MRTHPAPDAKLGCYHRFAIVIQGDSIHGTAVHASATPRASFLIDLGEVGCDIMHHNGSPAPVIEGVAAILATIADTVFFLLNIRPVVENLVHEARFVRGFQNFERFGLIDFSGKPLGNRVASRLPESKADFKGGIGLTIIAQYNLLLTAETHPNRNIVEFLYYIFNCLCW